MDNEFEISTHISQRFDNELEDIRNKVLLMGGLVETQVTNGIRALIDSDVELAEVVATSDVEINALEVEIDKQCVEIIARRQPAAGDLRLIVSIFKTIADLERIGDQAEKLGRLGLKINGDGFSASDFAELKHLGDLVQSILRGALDAFARMDVEDALETIADDRRVDAEFDALSRQLITHMMEDPRQIKNALRITWCARSLERIGDHAKNICEYVVYFVHGEDVRHTSIDQIREVIAEAEESAK